MIRLGKLTDYGLVLLTHIAQNHDRLLHTARDLAVESRLPLPTVSKLLKELLQGGLLVSHRGIKGGYSLARMPREISMAEIIAVIEGPIALTECSTERDRTLERSEEHTSELQSPCNLVCRLLLEKKKKKQNIT